MSTPADPPDGECEGCDAVNGSTCIECGYNFCPACWDTSRHAEQPCASVKRADPRDALVASPHFDLMRGMVLFYPGARPADMRATVVKGDADCIEGEEPVCYENGITRFKWNPRDGWRLDIEDHANHGHLLALVRKAWGDCVIEIVIEPNGAAAVEIFAAFDGRTIGAFEADTLGLALTAALLAAPEGA